LEQREDEREGRQRKGQCSVSGALRQGGEDRGARGRPGRVEATLDIRHQEDAIRERSIAALQARADEICARRGVTVSWSVIAEHGATPCTPELVATLADAVAQTGVEVRKLPSGAGHDAVTMASVTEIAMLFVRNAGGISHHPDESVEEADVALAIEAATRFARALFPAEVAS